MARVSCCKTGPLERKRRCRSNGPANRTRSYFFVVLFDVSVVVVVVSLDVLGGVELGVLEVVVSVVLELPELGDAGVVVVVVLEDELGGGAGVVDLVVVLVVVLVSRPSVRLRSEHAPKASVARVAATATPIARSFISFIIAPVWCWEGFQPGEAARIPVRTCSTPG